MKLDVIKGGGLYGGKVYGKNGIVNLFPFEQDRVCKIYGNQRQAKKVMTVMKKITLITFCYMCLITSCKQHQSSQGEDFLSKVDQNQIKIIDDRDKLGFFDEPGQPIPPAFRAFPSGSIKPKGWLFKIMKQDLDKGIVGALDELYPGIKADDLYRTSRRGGLEDVPEMGDLVLTGAAWEKSIMWWNAETIGNWWDGFVRHAFLLNDGKSIGQSKKIVENLLASQDGDGYIGIYKKNLRYQHDGSNGELWAQTTAFRMLLAYYEFTGDKRVLQAVERAMALTMTHYNESAKNPFELKNAFGGATHGLMLTDVCETLHRITGKSEYQDYATYLYKAFSSFSINSSFDDVRYPFLMQRDSSFMGHAVHVYEHLRSLLNAYHNTGHKELETAYDNAMFKLEKCILPSGAGHGNEWIWGALADPTDTASEFCALLELRNFYGSAIQKTGKIRFADEAEKLTYNAIMGSRNEDGTAITYGKPDNCYILNGRSISQDEEETRLKYSPTHSEPAVCCAPNYTRNFVYFLDQMWLKKDKGIAVALYGPSELSAEIEGAKVMIHQKTEYPLSDIIEFEIRTDKPVEFEFSFRKPGWSKKINFLSEEEQPEPVKGYYTIRKTWKSGDVVRISFHNELEVKEFHNGEVYFQKGPLVYALPIPHKEKVIKRYGVQGFTDYYCEPSNEDYKLFTFPGDGQFKYKERTSGSKPFTSTEINVEMANGEKKEQVRLIPMGGTILRKVTFNKTNEKKTL